MVQWVFPEQTNRIIELKLYSIHCFLSGALKIKPVSMPLWCIGTTSATVCRILVRGMKMPWLVRKAWAKQLLNLGIRHWVCLWWLARMLVNFINLPFCLSDNSSTSIYQLAILSTSNFVNLPYYQITISSTCLWKMTTLLNYIDLNAIVVLGHFVNLPFHQLVIFAN